MNWNFNKSGRVLCVHLTVGNDIYHQQTKLQEGNVFTGICLFTWGEWVTSNASWYRSHGRVSHNSTLDIRPGTYPYYWHLVAKTVDLFKLVYLMTSWEWHQVAATEARTVSKRAVQILLECFLVSDMNTWCEFLSSLFSSLSGWSLLPVL